jgi:hypothetical protein
MPEWRPEVSPEKRDPLPRRETASSGRVCSHASSRRRGRSFRLWVDHGRLLPEVGSSLAFDVAMESHKHLVRRLGERKQPDVPDDLAEGAFAELPRRWITPFRGSFPDFEMEIVNLVEEEDDRRARALAE